MLKAGRAGVPRLQWSVYRETPIAGATGGTVDLKCPYPSFKTLIYCPLGNTGDAAAQATVSNVLTTSTTTVVGTRVPNLSSIALTSAGTNIYSTTSHWDLRNKMIAMGYDARPDVNGQLVLYLAGDASIPAHLVGRNDVFVLNYGLMADGADQTGIMCK